MGEEEETVTASTLALVVRDSQPTDENSTSSADRRSYGARFLKTQSIQDGTLAGPSSPAAQVDPCQQRLHG